MTELFSWRKIIMCLSVSKKRLRETLDDYIVDNIRCTSKNYEASGI